MYWGGHTSEDIYWQPDISKLKLDFVPVLSRADADWGGACGYVQEALLVSGCDASTLLMYACGSIAMIHGAHAQLQAAGQPAKRFHSDAFVSYAPA